MKHKKDSAISCNCLFIKGRDQIKETNYCIQIYLGDAILVQFERKLRPIRHFDLQVTEPGEPFRQFARNKGIKTRKWKLRNNVVHLSFVQRLTSWSRHLGHPLSGLVQTFIVVRAHSMELNESSVVLRNARLISSLLRPRR